MSGGSHDYAYMKLNDVADSFDVNREKVDHIKARQKVADILRHMSDICHGIEWIDSADYGEDDWPKVLEKLALIELKSKQLEK